MSFSQVSQFVLIFLCACCSQLFPLLAAEGREWVLFTLVSDCAYQ